MALGGDITEPSSHHRSGRAMRPWQWAQVWMWLAGLGTVESGGKLSWEQWEGGRLGCGVPAPERLGGQAWAFLFALHASLPSSLPGVGSLMESSADPQEVPGTKSRPSTAVLGLCGLARPWVCLSLLGGGHGSVWLFHRLCSGSPAPSLESAKALARGAESPVFLDRPDFFDYPDSDQARLLALAQFIGERPVIFVNSGMTQLEKGLPSLPGPGGQLPLALRLEMSPGPLSQPHCLAGSNSRLFHHILVGALVVAFFFLLFQFCTHM
eukprot:bmy_00778T0